MEDPESARAGGVSHILAEKRGVSLTIFQKKCMKMQYFHKEGGGRTPGTPYAGSATGFMEHRSTTSQPIDSHTYSDSSRNLDFNGQTNITFLEIATGFDSVPHDLLAHKF